MARIAEAGVEAVAGGRERRLVFNVLETHKDGVKVKYYLSYLLTILLHMYPILNRGHRSTGSARLFSVQFSDDD